jgi:aspartyl-tRNA(Asn)/glutamyl-tRNA(Gln) amidotransferase subunit C
LKITEKEVRYVAALAHLDLSGEEVARMQHDLDDILSHIDKLNELDTSSVEPMAQVLFEGDAAASNLRPDTPHTPLDNATALRNAALSGAGHFKVPKVIER